MKELIFECFTSGKKAHERYFRIVTDDALQAKIGHGEGYTKGTSVLHAIALIKDGKYKVERHAKGKSHSFSLVARNGEVIFQSNTFRNKESMELALTKVIACVDADIVYV